MLFDWIDLMRRQTLRFILRQRIAAAECHLGDDGPDLGQHAAAEVRDPQVDTVDHEIAVVLALLVQVELGIFDDEFPEGGQHTPMPDPFNEDIRQAMIKAAKDLGIKHHTSGTVITIEGNRFSTRAESHMFRAWGADVIKMSIAPECILANEAGIPYGVVAMSTDYDCWKEDEAPVSWEEILEVFRANVGTVTELLINTIPQLKT